MEGKHKELADLQATLTQQKISQDTHEEELTIWGGNLGNTTKAAQEKFQAQLAKQIEDAWQDKENALKELSRQHSSDLEASREQAKVPTPRRSTLPGL